MRRSTPPRAWPRRRRVDDDRIIGLCGALLDNEKTDKADRIKALLHAAQPLAART